MNCVQQLMKPGYGDHNLLESVADFILIPSRWMWEDKSVSWVKETNKNELKPVYSSSENRMHDCFIGTGGASLAILTVGAGYAASSILLSPFLGVGLALKSIALEKSPKSKEYNALVVAHLNKCGDMSEIEESFRNEWFYSPGDKAERRRMYLQNLQNNIKQLEKLLEKQLELVIAEEEDIDLNNNILSIKRNLIRLENRFRKHNNIISQYKKMPRDFIEDVKKLMGEASPLLKYPTNDSAQNSESNEII